MMAVLRQLATQPTRIGAAVAAIWALVHGILVGQVDPTVITAAITAVLALAVGQVVTPLTRPRDNQGPLVPLRQVMPQPTEHVELPSTYEQADQMSAALRSDAGPAEPAPAAPTATSGLAGADAYDPAAHTVPEVQAYLQAHPDQRDAILVAERAGKARKGVLSA